MSKPHVVVMSHDPLIVRVVKNGRAVSVAVAKMVLAREYPGKVFEFPFVEAHPKSSNKARNHHSTEAREVLLDDEGPA